jgi:hypothetical protein
LTPPQRDPTTERNYLSNTAAGRFSSAERTMRSTSGTSSLTTLWKRRRSERESVLRRWPARCAIFFRSDGCIRKKPMSAGIQSGFIISRWNFLSGARSRTMLRIFSSIRSRENSLGKKISIGSSCWNRSQTRVWVTAASDDSRPASSIQWLRCKFQRWGMACATNTVSSNRPSRTAGSRNYLITGSVVLIPGKSRVPTRQSR